MDHISQKKPSSINCELRIIRVKNVRMKSNGELFVRCFLPLGNHRRVRIDTCKILSNSSPLVWDQSFALECHDNIDCNNFLSGESLVVELRWRSMVPLIGKIRGSQLLGRAEIPWKLVMDSPQMKMETWLIMTSSGRASCAIGDAKTPALQIGLEVTIPTTNCAILELTRMRRRRNIEMVKGEEPCGWDMSGSLSYELLAMTATFDVM